MTGGGGLDWSFHTTDYQTVWANDINEWAVRTFCKNFSDAIVSL
ncbi:MAG: DNA cytosine methyltransferase [Planctomycetaceae bacterium]|nr:DNA cytosine methyltransferase [Planctomycetaceae bacterium]